MYMQYFKMRHNNYINLLHFSFSNAKLLFLQTGLRLHNFAAAFH